MNPLLPNTTSPAVSELQLALQHLLDHGLVLADDADLRRELTLALAVEQRQAVFGPTTVRLIAQLRVEHALPSNPGLDASAADLIRTLLKTSGLTLRLEVEAELPTNPLPRWRQRLAGGVANLQEVGERAQQAGQRARERLEEVQEGLEQTRDDLQKRATDLLDGLSAFTPRRPDPLPKTPTPEPPPHPEEHPAMSPILAPIHPGSTGPDVANLQAALAALLTRELLLSADPELRARLRRELRQERDDARYGDATQRLVEGFQQERDLAGGGAVDGPTADALNALLKELGLLEDAPRELLVQGTARYWDGRPVAGGLVRVEWLPEPRLAGETTTDADGRYRVALTSPGSSLDMALRVFLIDASGLLLAESPPLERPEPVTLLDFILPQELTPGPVEPPPVEPPPVEPPPVEPPPVEPPPVEPPPVEPPPVEPPPTPKSIPFQPYAQALTNYTAELLILGAPRSRTPLRVELHDRAELCPDLIEVAEPDASGRAAITLPGAYVRTLFGDRRPELFFRVYDREGQLLGSTEEGPTWKLLNPREAIQIQLTGRPQRGPEPTGYTVRGQIHTTEPVEGWRVSAGDQGLRGEPAPLGEAEISAHGEYSVAYGWDPLRARGKHHADLVIWITDATGQVRFRSDVLHQAHPTLVLDAVLDPAALRPPDTFTAIGRALWPRLDGVDPATLTEAEADHLAASLNLNPDAVRVLIAAFSLVARARDSLRSLTHKLAFGLIAEGTPANLDAVFALRAAELRRRLESAVARGHIAPVEEAERTRLIREIQDRWASAEGVGGTAALAGVLGAEQAALFTAAWFEHDGDAADFGDALARHPAFEAPEARARLSRGLALSALLDHAPALTARVVEALGEGAPPDLRALARLSAEDWTDVVKDHVPPDVRARSDQSAAQIYARALAQRVEAAVPTAALAASLRRAVEVGEALDDRDRRVLDFLEVNPDFHFGARAVNRYLTPVDGTPPREAPDAATLGAVAAYNRVYRLVDGPRRGDQMRALLRDGLDSGVRIANMDPDTFEMRYAEALGGAAAARQTWSRASGATQLSHTLALGLRADLSRGVPWAADSGTDALVDALPTGSPGLPDWRALFGALDWCACEHCQSALSPAAYLVDLLHFVDQKDLPRDLDPLQKDALSPRFKELRRRRPDIPNIQLTCTNTNTVLPTIDLVLEVLEAEVVRVHGGVGAHAENRQTTGSAADLALQPEHVDPRAYTILSSAVSARNLPFDLYTADLRGSLALAGTTRLACLEVFERGNPQESLDADRRARLARERLQLPHQGWALITDARDSVPLAWNLWGRDVVWWSRIATSPESLALPNAVPLGEVLRAGGYTYAELTTLLSTRAVNGPTPNAGAPVVVAFAGQTCSLEEAYLTVLGLPDQPTELEQSVARDRILLVLGRIPRFSRLQAALSWTTFETDLALEALGGVQDTATVTALVELGQLRQRMGRTVPELVAWYADIPLRAQDTETPSLYASLFLNKGIQNPTDPLFEVQDGKLVAEANQRVVLAVLAPVTPANMRSPRDRVLRLGAKAATVASALRRSMAELAALIGGAGLPADAAGEVTLTLANLSSLYRHSSLARALDLSVDELLASKRLHGANPFASPASTLDFVAAATRRGPLSGLELEPILCGAPDLLDDAAVVDVLNALRRVAATVQSETAPTSDADGQRLHELLLQSLPASVTLNTPTPWTGPTASVVGDLLSILRGDVAKIETAHRGRVYALLCSEAVGLAQSQAKTLADLQASDSFNSQLYSLEGDPPPQSWVELAQHWILAARRPVVLQARALALLGERFQLGALAEPLLAQHMRLEFDVPTGLSGAQAVLLALLDPTLLLSAQEESAPTTWTLHARILRRVAACAPLLRGLGVSTEELEHVMLHGARGGWIYLGLLSATDDADVVLQRSLGWRRLAAAYELRATLGGEHGPLFRALAVADHFAQPEADPALWGPARTSIIDDLVSLGYRSVDVEAMLQIGGVPFQNATGWRDERSWGWLVAGLELARRSGFAVADLARWSGDVGADEARAARAAVRGRYDDDGWASAARPRRDALREAQRDALVAWILTNALDENGPLFDDANALYRELLIDVQQSACDETSRVREALSAVQLFVQQGMLGLVKDVKNVRIDYTNSERKRWEWMKTYRVWEANRKVFLWPETWLEPELRDDKSPFFEELERELFQRELTDESAERAIGRYLEQLHQVSRLDVRATCHEIEPEGMTDPERRTVDRLWVFARTSTTPHLWFWRQRDRGVWGAWRKLDLDIEGEHLMAVMWNRRPYLVWPIFEEKTEKPPADSKVPVPGKDTTTEQPKTYLVAKLALSAYVDGGWKQKQVTGQAFEWRDADATERADAMSRQARRATLVGEIASLTSDLQSLNREQEDLRNEIREELTQLEFDIAVSHRLNGRPEIDTKVIEVEIKLFPEIHTVEVWNGNVIPLEPPIPQRLNEYIANQDSINSKVGTKADLELELSRTPSSDVPMYTNWSLLMSSRIQFYAVPDAKSGNLVVQADVDQFWIRWSGLGGSATMAATISAGTGDLIGVESNVSRRDIERLSGDAKSQGYICFLPTLKLPLKHRPWRKQDDDFVLRGDSTRGAKSYLPLIENGGNSTPDLPTLFRQDSVRSFVIDPLWVDARSISPSQSAGDPRQSAILAASAAAVVADPKGTFTERLDANDSIQVLSPSNMVAQLAMGGVSRAPARPTAAPSTRSIREQQRDARKASHSPTAAARTKMNLDVRWKRRFNFRPFYHPYSTLFLRTLHRRGVSGLLAPTLQAHAPDAADRRYLLRQGVHVPGAQSGWSFSSLQPTEYVSRPYPQEDIDFRPEGAYALYNWETFFHIPLRIAVALSGQQRFEEALRWFHYIFDPTLPPQSGVTEASPQRFWRVKPLYQTYGRVSPSATAEEKAAAANASPIEALLYLYSQEENANGSASALVALVRAQIERWKEKPFNPYAIARLRPATYQRAVVMKYIDNLVAWGDCLFAQDTREAIGEATLLYVLAQTLLGPRPQEVETRDPEPRSYEDLRGHLDDFSNALVELEQGLSDEALVNGTAELLPGFSPTLYFCVPPNQKLLARWDTVEDRLYKVRHCLNLEGIARKLALFDPPIDPGDLVRLAARGGRIDAFLAERGAGPPQHRYPVLVQRAKELCGEVRAFGGALLSALEKRDAELLALLRSGHELALLDRVRGVRLAQIQEAKQGLAALEAGRKVVQAKHEHYQGLIDEGLIEGEQVQLIASTIAHGIRNFLPAANSLALAAAGTPDAFAGMAGAFGSPLVYISPPGTGAKAADGLKTATAAFLYLAQISDAVASVAGTLASHDRREQDWTLQRDLSTHELVQIDAQITAAEQRVAIAEAELRNHDLQRANSAELDDFMRKQKVSNEQLYSWMVSQLGAAHQQVYALALTMARRAERAWQHEVGGESPPSFISAPPPAALPQGLLAGELLSLDLARMDVAYLDQSRREYELTRHVSLNQLDPSALLLLRATGSCEVTLPEALFDLDCPGHYHRRIKTVSLSLPCVAGPYAPVHCTLTLLKHETRVTARLTNGQYVKSPTGDDDRFRVGYGAVQSIVTSSGQNDAGLFEANLRDERLLPFEGKGAISTWRLELPATYRPFDLNTISDAILHLRYTAREGGESVKQAAQSALKAGLAEAAKAADGLQLQRVFALRTDNPTEWHTFLHGPEPVLHVDLSTGRYPYAFQRHATIRPYQIDVWILGDKSIGGAVEVYLYAEGATRPEQSIQLTGDGSGVLRGALKAEPEGVLPNGRWRMEAGTPADRLDSTKLREAFLVVHYVVKST